MNLLLGIPEAPGKIKDLYRHAVKVSLTTVVASKAGEISRHDDFAEQATPL